VKNNRCDVTCNLKKSKKSVQLRR